MYFSIDVLTGRSRTRGDNDNDDTDSESSGSDDETSDSSETESENNGNENNVNVPKDRFFSQTFSQPHENGYQMEQLNFNNNNDNNNENNANNSENSNKKRKGRGKGKKKEQRDASFRGWAGALDSLPLRPLHHSNDDVQNGNENDNENENAEEMKNKNSDKNNAKRNKNKRKHENSKNSNENENNSENNDVMILSGYSDAIRPLRKVTFWTKLTTAKRRSIESFTNIDTFLDEHCWDIKNQTEHMLVQRLSEIIDLVKQFHTLTSKQRKILSVYILEKYEIDFQCLVNDYEEKTDVARGLTTATVSRSKIIKFLNSLAKLDSTKMESINPIIIQKAGLVMSSVYVALGTTVILHETAQWANMFRELMDQDEELFIDNIGNIDNSINKENDNNNEIENEKENKICNLNVNENDNEHNAKQIDDSDFEIVLSVLQKYYNVEIKQNNMNAKNNNNNNNNNNIDDISLEKLKTMFQTFEQAWTNPTNVSNDDVAAETKKLNHTLNMSKGTIHIPMLILCDKSDSWFKKGKNRPTMVQLLKTIQYWQTEVTEYENQHHNHDNENNNMNDEIIQWKRKIAFFTSTNSLRRQIDAMLEVFPNDRNVNANESESQSQSQSEIENDNGEHGSNDQSLSGNNDDKDENSDDGGSVSDANQESADLNSKRGKKGKDDKKEIDE